MCAKKNPYVIKSGLGRSFALVLQNNNFAKYDLELVKDNIQSTVNAIVAQNSQWITRWILVTYDAYRTLSPLLCLPVHRQVPNFSGQPNHRDEQHQQVCQRSPSRQPDYYVPSELLHAYQQGCHGMPLHLYNISLNASASSGKFRTP